MAQKRSDAYAITDGALALQEDVNYREAAERYGRDDRRPAPQPRAEAKPRKRSKAVLLALLFFAAAFALLMRQIGIEREIVALHDMRTELTQEQRRGEDLSLELSLKMDIDNVQRTAKEVMNMNYPDVEMTRSVELPTIKTGSTIEKANTVVDQEETDAFAAWLDGIAESLGR